MTGYLILDYLLTLLHLLIVGFNLLGWIWPATRRAHFIVVVVTASCWLLLGIWYGIGYCPLTDWQWQLKEHLGEQGLPNSFIKYMVDKVSPVAVYSDTIDTLTAGGFAIAAFMSVYLNFFRKKKRK
ncbi:DUF2784 domain-containing protein [Pedobacter psychroterrae]|uniref:DUF2784 family protein n=1 Tax=Pedobacter psychroterrae TaxID=2530453 RepID=A0A4R0NHT6_9SPHI|nr:DUF2784 domain-containing protein [Pedobacter psychroterrae]TCD00161.1 DUF2784 family protein [Pedobacter psychroterrae]